MRKYVSEFFGTLFLVLVGCGTAVACGGFTGGTDGGFLGVVAISLAFGLALLCGAYSIGKVSGCHINPAVSLSMLILGKISFKDFWGYVVGQILGAFAGTAILKAIVGSTTQLSAANGLGANGYGELSGLGINAGGAFILELILTFIFVMLIIGVVTGEKTSHMGGVVIALALIGVHLIAIPLTGCSVNPARSLSAAVFTGGTALSQIWLFIVAPLVGGVLAAIASKALKTDQAE